MGPMVRKSAIAKRRLVKLAATWLVALFVWSLVASPASVGQAEEPTEPEQLSAYFTDADAAAILGYVRHAALPAPPCAVNAAHSVSDVALPSAASGLALLTDFGICNGLHGTTTGAAVPTEASARQPGGAPTAEFVLAGGPIGEEEFGRAAAGVARASAGREGSPRGFAHSYLGNVVLFPAAGSPPQPPGTYDPDATFPGGDAGAATPDPAPQHQMGIVSIGSIASSTESIRNSETVTSIAVAELHGINIGNRTSDNRCTNCITIDTLRVEAFAETNGTPTGVRSGHRVLIGRACRRALNTDPEPDESGLRGPREVDTCLPLERFGNGTATGGLYELNPEAVDALNELLGEPLLISDNIAIRIQAGRPGHVDEDRPQRVPAGDPCRNYHYPDPKGKPIAECDAAGSRTGPDRDKGEEAKAVAEGLDIDILHFSAAGIVPSNEQLDSCFGLYNQPPLSEIPTTTGNAELDIVVGTAASCPVGKLRSVRTLNFTLGAVSAGAIARVLPPVPPVDFGGDTGGGGALPPIAPGPVGGEIPPVTGGDGVTVVGGGGLGQGTYGLRIDWSSFKIRPWKAGDIAKASLFGVIVGGMIWLARRRLRFGPV